ncbi:MAG: benzoyl-CoA reductase subunit D [Rhodothermales bacterium]
MLNTIGIDIGSSAIKVALLEHPFIEERIAAGAVPNPNDGQRSRVVNVDMERIRKRDPHAVAELCFHRVLEAAGMESKDLAYIAATGEGDTFVHKTGYFFGMTAHGRGANFLFPEARSVLDIGALHQRAMVIDERSKVLKYRMTGQCASGSGQFLENISRYLGVTTEEIGELSLKSTSPEKVSGICAVLAETDVINMVSRGITNEDILKGIHLSLTGRMAKLFRSAGGEFPLVLTGGLALDVGLAKTLEEEFKKKNMDPVIKTHELSPYAGAIGAALWGAFRYHKQEAKARPPSPRRQQDIRTFQKEPEG